MDLQEAKNSWNAEKNSAYLYQIIAQYEAKSSIGDLFSKLAEETNKQADLWAQKLKSKFGKTPEAFKPNFRTKIIARLIPIFGPKLLRNILSATKLRGMSVYSTVIPSQTAHPTPNYLKDVGRRHHSAGAGGILRAAVFGINDGLVSNASLILGIAGASAQNHWILVSGIAGLLAGAFSMGTGEYISVRSQREMLEYQVKLEKEELKLYPEEEAAELALIYEAKGLTILEARQLSEKIIRNPDLALDTLAREELGLNPEELGSPIYAALFSFFSFSLGALIPLLPFLFSHHGMGLVFSIILTALSLFLVGASLSFFTGRSFLWGGLRMLLLGGSAGAATFGIGKLLGVSLS